MNDYTVVIAIDREHWHELQQSRETWLKNCETLFDVPWLILADDDVYEELQAVHSLSQMIGIYRHEKLVRVTSPKDCPQRERMLASFILQAPFHVDTRFFLKLDTDSIKVNDLPFPKAEWFENEPVLISSAWGYSKPADVIQRLDDWGDTVPEIAKYPRLNIPFDPASSRVCHRRIISNVYLGRTDWHRWLAGLCNGRLPVPSQDTLCWYVAARTGAFYRTEKMKRYGWHHIGRGGKRLEQAVREVLGENSDV